MSRSFFIVVVLLVTGCAGNDRHSALGISFSLPDQWGVVDRSEVVRLIRQEKEREARRIALGRSTGSKSNFSHLLNETDSIVVTWYGRAPKQLSWSEYLVITRIASSASSRLNEPGYGQAMCASYLNTPDNLRSGIPFCEIRKIGNHSVLHLSQRLSRAVSSFPYVLDMMVFQLAENRQIILMFVATPRTRQRLANDVERIVMSMRAL